MCLGLIDQGVDVFLRLVPLSVPKEDRDRPPQGDNQRRRAVSSHRTFDDASGALRRLIGVSAKPEISSHRHFAWEMKFVREIDRRPACTCPVGKACIKFGMRMIQLAGQVE
jgi:hypothetical protein